VGKGEIGLRMVMAQKETCDIDEPLRQPREQIPHSKTRGDGRNVKPSSHAYGNNFGW